MKTLIIIVLQALTSRAFNLTQYYLGTNTGLGFNDTQVQDGIVCLNAISNDINQLYTLFESGDFESILEDLAIQIIQTYNNLQTRCQPYGNDLINYIRQNTNITDLPQIIKENFLQKYPYIISNFGQWIDLLGSGQEFSAGLTETLTIRILLGTQKTNFNPLPQVNSSLLVPFNASLFFNEFFKTLFPMIGIQVKPNFTSLSQCFNMVQNLSLAFFDMKEDFSTMDFDQKVETIDYVISTSANGIESCEEALEIGEFLIDPILEAFQENPIDFTSNIIKNIMITFPTLQSSINKEIIHIKEGNYAQAGSQQGALLFNLFSGIITTWGINSSIPDS